MQGTKFQRSNTKALFFGKHLKTVTEPAPICGTNCSLATAAVVLLEMKNPVHSYFSSL
jgi:hypothetical protein